MIARRNGMIGAAAAALLVTAALFSAGVAAQDATSTWDGIFTAEQAERGPGGLRAGMLPSAISRICSGTGIAPSLICAPFHFRWSELSVGDMLVAIRTTMPQGAPASLSPRAYVGHRRVHALAQRLPRRRHGAADRPGRPGVDHHPARGAVASLATLRSACGRIRLSVARPQSRVTGERPALQSAARRHSRTGTRCRAILASCSERISHSAPVA